MSSPNAAHANSHPQAMEPPWSMSQDVFAMQASPAEGYILPVGTFPCLLAYILSIYNLYKHRQKKKKFSSLGGNISSYLSFEKENEDVLLDPSFDMIRSIC
jgi:hypothetical protein